MIVIRWLIAHRHYFWAQQTLYVLGVEIPASVKIGESVILEHRGRGVVMADNIVIGDRVTIYHHVTLGRSGAQVPSDERIDQPAVHIGDDAILFPGAVVIGASARPVSVGTGTVIGANSVLNQSTGAWEIWSGVPARKIKDRQDRGTWRQGNI